jgi:hypothetical protein
VKALTGVVVLLGLWSGCATAITGITDFSFSFSEEKETSCGDIIGALIAGIAIDGMIAGTATFTGETFSPPDRLIVGVLAVDVVAATVVTIKGCAD